MPSAEAITPQRLHALLAPAWRLDAPGEQGLTLRDVRAGSLRPCAHPAKRPSLVAEWTTERGEDVWIELARAERTEHHTVRTRGLTLTHWAPPELRATAWAACQTAARCIERSTSENAPCWIGVDASGRGFDDEASFRATEADTARAPLEVPRGAAGDDITGRLLTLDGRAVRQRDGAMPILLEHASRDAFSIRYPRHPDGYAAVGTHVHRLIPEVWGRRQVRRYLATLGFAADEAGWVRTVPHPSSWPALAARAGLSALLPEPRVVASRWPRVPRPRWARAVNSGQLQVVVWPAAASMPRVVLRRRRRFGMPIDVGMLPHDLGVHLLAWHRVPTPFWLELRRLAGRSRKSAPDDRRARALAVFYESTLTVAGQSLWTDPRAPQTFDRGFADRAGPLLAALALALDGDARR